MGELSRTIRLVFLGAVLCVAHSAARADLLVDYLDRCRMERREAAGDFYLAHIQSLKSAADRTRTGTIRLEQNLRVPDAPSRMVELAVETDGILPMDVPVVVCLTVEDDRAWLHPIEVGGRSALVLDRGEKDGRFMELTRQLLFDERPQRDTGKLLADLLALTGGRDQQVAELAAAYLGSSLSPFARTDIDFDTVEAITDAMFASTRAVIRQYLARFYTVGRLPRDTRRLAALLASDEPDIVNPTIYRLKRSATQPQHYVRPLTEILEDRGADLARARVLSALRAWGPAGKAFWPTVSRLATGETAFALTEAERLAAVELLLRVDPDRAERPIRTAVVQMDAPVIYRFLYNRRMVDTIDILIDKLRHGRTRQPEAVRAVLGRLTGAVLDDADTAWVRWWDGVVDDGRKDVYLTGRHLSRKPDRTEVDRLVARLGSPRFDERRQAALALLQLGDAVKPALQKATESADFETAEVAGELIEAWQVRKQRQHETLFGKRD